MITLMGQSPVLVRVIFLKSRVWALRNGGRGGAAGNWCTQTGPKARPTPTGLGTGDASPRQTLASGPRPDVPPSSGSPTPLAAAFPQHHLGVCLECRQSPFLTSPPPPHPHTHTHPSPLLRTDTNHKPKQRNQEAAAKL